VADGDVEIRSRNLSILVCKRQGVLDDRRPTVRGGGKCTELAPCRVEMDFASRFGLCWRSTGGSLSQWPSAVDWMVAFLAVQVLRIRTLVQIRS